MIDLGAIPVQSLLPAAGLPEEATSFLTPDMSADKALTVLGKKKLSQDAIPVLAEALPEREGVWWACESCKKVPLEPEGVEAVKAAETWVKAPSPEAAQAAAAAATKAGHDNPAGWAAQAAAWSEPSIMGDAPPGMAKKATAGSVKLASLQHAEMLPEIPEPELPPPPEPPDLTTDGFPPMPEVTNTLDVPPPDDAPPTPKEKKKASKAADPFIKIGREVASGENHW